MKLSIIIPVYNEQNTFLKLLKKVEDLKLENIEKEIIIVDDFSTDGTRNLINGIKDHRVIFNEFNMGKGATVIRGLKVSTGDILVIQDADLEYNPEDFKKLIKPIIAKEFQVVYGSRFLNKKETIFGKNKTLIPIHYIGNKVLSLITSILYFNKIIDMETCYKMFTREVFNKLNLKSKRFDFEPEITSKILKNGYKIKEMPINFHPRNFNEGKKINWKDGVKAIYYLLKFRFVN